MMLVKCKIELILELDNRWVYGTSKDSFGNGRSRPFTTLSSHNRQIDVQITFEARKSTVPKTRFLVKLRSRCSDFHSDFFVETASASCNGKYHPF